MKLDHVFVGTDNIQSAAAVLSQIGLNEGSSNQHPGQGTANRRYFFGNAMLELLYVDETVDCNHPQNHLLNLEARCRARLDDRSMSKIGVCFRPSRPDTTDPFFECVAYKPAYLPSALHIDIDCERRAGEPLWFHLPFTSDAEYIARSEQEPLVHPCGVSEITELHITTSADALSASAQSLSTVPNLNVVSGTYSLMTMDFDHRVRGVVMDLRPQLPLILRW